MPPGAWSAWCWWRRDVRACSPHDYGNAELARAIIAAALPAQAEPTLEEVFEAWTWAQLGLHAKPCGLLNVAGYFDGLIAFLDHTVREGFVKEANRAMLTVSLPVSLKVLTPP